MNPRFQPLSDEEIARLIRAAWRGMLRTRGFLSRGEAQVAIDKLVECAANTRVLHATLDLILDGELDVVVDEDGNLCVVPSRRKRAEVPAPFSAN